VSARGRVCARFFVMLTRECQRFVARAWRDAVLLEMAFDEE
jgi:hypothetical protein